MRWHVRGANRQTGQSVELIVEAATPDEAAYQASSMGVIVSAPPVPADRPVDYVLPAAYAPYPVECKKIAAGLCAILLGWLGIHKFVLGYTTEGVVFLLISLLGGVVTCGVATAVMSVIALIEGILYLTKSDPEFIQTYQIGRRGWF